MWSNPRCHWCPWLSRHMVQKRHLRWYVNISHSSGMVMAFLQGSVERQERETDRRNKRRTEWVLAVASSQRTIKHYENTPFEIYRKFHLQKLKIFNSDIFHISAQNIDCGYSLEPPQWGGSTEYPHSMFWAEIRKIINTPVNPSFAI